MEYLVTLDNFSYFSIKTCFRYSVGVPHLAASNEYLKQVF